VRNYAAQQFDGNDVDWLVPHQANLRIIDACAKRMELDKSKVMINIGSLRQHDGGDNSALSVGMVAAGKDQKRSESCASQFWCRIYLGSDSREVGN